MGVALQAGHGSTQGAPNPHRPDPHPPWLSRVSHRSPVLSSPMPLKAGSSGPTLSNATTTTRVVASGPGSDAAGVLSPPLGTDMMGSAARGAVCHALGGTVPLPHGGGRAWPIRLQAGKTEQLLLDCVGRENLTLLRRFTETIDGKERGWR
ncbi:unnamed protein product [Urochloa humidicola]